MEKKRPDWTYLCGLLCFLPVFGVSLCWLFHRFLLPLLQGLVQRHTDLDAFWSAVFVSLLVGSCIIFVFGLIQKISNGYWIDGISEDESIGGVVGCILFGALIFCIIVLGIEYFGFLITLLVACGVLCTLYYMLGVF